ncbi:MAG: response regulator transcription factor [Solobacterium sp.]|nr:response regulator transcription factor [Solobacterium sp.]
MKTIQIIEDDKSLREELSILLKHAGYDVVMVEHFSDVYRQMTETTCDLILLDISLPEENGELLLQKYRRKHDTPVIMLTSRSSEMDEVISLSYGANDYITKPYHPTILLLRIAEILKRKDSPSKINMYQDIQVNLLKGTLSRDRQEEILTKNEMIIFQMLLEHQGEIVQREVLMTALWNNDEFLNDNALSVNVSRLRAKLGSFGLSDAIETRKKLGYLLK